MLLDNLLKPGIIQLRELGQIMHVRNNAAQVLLQHLELILDILLLLLAHRNAWLLARVEPRNQLPDLLLLVPDHADQLRGLDLLEGEDLVELELELRDELFLVVFGPFAARRVGVRGRGLGRVGCFEGVLEVVVVDVVVVVVAD